MQNGFSLKFLYLGLSLVGIAGLFSFLLRSFTNSPHFGNFLVVSVAGLVFLGILSVFNILTDNKIVALIVFLISALALSAGFLNSSLLVSGSGALISLIFFFWAYQETRQDLKNNLTIRFWKVAHRSAGYASSGLAIFSIMAYLSLFNFSDPTSLRKTLEVAIRPLEPIFAGYIPNFTVRTTITQLATGLLPDDIKILPVELKNQAISQATDRLVVLMGNYAKIPIRAGDQIIDIVYRATLGKLLDYSPVARTAVMVLAGIVIYFLLKFLLIFANWFSVSVSYLLFIGLKKAGFFEIQLQSIDKEVIVIK